MSEPVLKSDKDARISAAARNFKEAARDLKIKNAFNTASWRDLELKRGLEEELFRVIDEVDRG